MKLPEAYRGYSLAVASYLTQAAGSIGSKELIDASSVEGASVFWYFTGTLMSLAILQFGRGGVKWRLLRRNMDVYLQISLIMTVSGLAWFIGLKLAGPGIVAFVQQLATVLGVLMGAFLLGERIKLIDGLGAVLAVAGALIITYSSEPAVIWGVAAAVVNALGLAVQGFLVKRHVARLDNFELLFVRSIVAAIVIPIFFVLTGGFELPSLWLLPGFFLVCGVGYVVFNLLAYFSLSFADLAKVSVLRVITPPTAMVGAYFVFGTIPTVMQVAGGCLILAGVSLILVQPLIAHQRDSEMESSQWPI